MTTENFVANKGTEGSIEIKKRGHGSILPALIGFISNEGEFFFDTEGGQVQIPADQLKELFGLIREATYIFIRKAF